MGGIEAESVSVKPDAVSHTRASAAVDTKWQWREIILRSFPALTNIRSQSSIRQLYAESYAAQVYSPERIGYNPFEGCRRNLRVIDSTSTCENCSLDANPRKWALLKRNRKKVYWFDPP